MGKVLRKITDKIVQNALILLENMKLSSFRIRTDVRTSIVTPDGAGVNKKSSCFRQHELLNLTFLHKGSAKDEKLRVFLCICDFGRVGEKVGSKMLLKPLCIKAYKKCQ